MSLFFGKKYLHIGLVTLRLMRDYSGIQGMFRVMFRDVQFGSRSKHLQGMLSS